MAVGGKVEITTIPGYLPLAQDATMNEMYRANAVSLVGEANMGVRSHGTGSTDMGDVSQIMPAIHPYVGGATGLGHGANYVVEDYNLAVVTATKALASTAIDLLADGANNAGSVISGQRAEMTREQYLAFMRQLASEETFRGKDS